LERQESSKRNYHIISSKVIIKAIVIKVLLSPGHKFKDLGETTAKTGDGLEHLPFSYDILCQMVSLLDTVEK